MTKRQAEATPVSSRFWAHKPRLRSAKGPRATHRQLHYVRRRAGAVALAAVVAAGSPSCHCAGGQRDRAADEPGAHRPSQPGDAARSTSELEEVGGIRVVYGIDLDMGNRARASEVRRELEAVIDERGLDADVRVPRAPPGAIDIVPGEGEAWEAGELLSDIDASATRRPCPSRLPERSVCVDVGPGAERARVAVLEQATHTLRERLAHLDVHGARAYEREGEIVVDVPAAGAPSAISRVQSVLERQARLELVLVEDDSEIMRELTEHARADERARGLGIEVEDERWTHLESGETFRDRYLRAEDRLEFMSEKQALEYGCAIGPNAVRRGEKIECAVAGRTVLADYLADLILDKPELEPSGDFEIGYGHVAPPEGTGVEGKSYWRTYLLRRRAELSGSDVERVSVVVDEARDRAEAVVQFDRAGARRFGQLTAENEGGRIALVLDGRVNAAPVIQSPITGGRLPITFAGTAEEQQQRAAELAALLNAGSLPSPLIEMSISRIESSASEDGEGAPP